MLRIPLVSHDKANHAIYGFLICLVVALAAMAFSVEPAGGALGGFLSASAAAWGKELYDRHGSGTYDPDDATATMLGAVGCAASINAPSLAEFARSLVQ